MLKHIPSLLRLTFGVALRETGYGTHGKFILVFAGRIKPHAASSVGSSGSGAEGGPETLLWSRAQRLDSACLCDVGVATSCEEAREHVQCVARSILGNHMTWDGTKGTRGRTQLQKVTTMCDVCVCV